jgi:hypothetical protein
MIRALFKRDLDSVRKIHEQFYGSEFGISDLQGLTCGFTAVDDNDQVICAGGIRSIMEIVIVTDKNVPILQRQQALFDMLKTARNSTKEAGYRQLHAFVQDEKWERHLIKQAGFRHTVGKALVIEV